MRILGLTNFILTTSSIPFSHKYYHHPHFNTISLTLNPRKPHPLPLFAASNNNNNNGVKEEESQEQEQQQKRPFFGFNWSNLLEPDPDNILALGLTGILTWASVQVLCQLLFISLAIVVAALKYSFIAALLIFILIALL